MCGNLSIKIIITPTIPMAHMIVIILEKKGALSIRFLNSRAVITAGMEVIMRLITSLKLRFLKISTQIFKMRLR